MALSFAFDPSKGETPQTIAQRRQMSNLIAARMLGTAPKNVGEGLNAIGQALIARSMMGDADAAQKAGEASLPAFLQPGASPQASIASAISGQPIASGAATPAGNTTIPAGTIDPRLKDAISNVASVNPDVDPAYMSRLALVENGGKVEGGSPLSSAQGPFQFLKGTAQQYGLTNPNDPTASADAAARFTLDNKAALTQALGREPTPGELYLAHQQGASGATKLLANPNAPVESVIGAQAARNNGATPGMTAGQFANKWTGKFNDIVQTVDPSQKNIIDAQADMPVASPTAVAGAVPADTGDGSDAALPPNAQPAQGALPTAQAVQAAAQPQNRFLFKNASDEDLQKALLNPFTPENFRTALTQEYKMRAEAAQKTTSAPYHDADGNLVQKDPFGKVTVLNPADKAPTSVLEYKYYRDNFQPSPDQKSPMDYATWSTAKARAGAMTVNNNIGGGSDKQVFDTFAENTKEARAAATGLVALRNARQALQGPGGAITGFGADERLTLQKLGAAVGVTDPSAIQNTETFRAAIAPQVAAMLKSTVGTNQISNSDREFAEKAAGGSIKLDAGSINRLLGIMENAGTARLKLHQQQLDAVYPDPEKNKRERALFSVTVPDAPSARQPAATQQPAIPQPGAIQGGYRFRGGDPSKRENWEPVT
jgi:hypothetical protein